MLLGIWTFSYYTGDVYPFVVSESIMSMNKHNKGQQFVAIALSRHAVVKCPHLAIVLSMYDDIFTSFSRLTVSGLVS